MDNDIEGNEDTNVGSQRSSKRPQASKSAHNELSRIDPLTGQRIANTESEVYKKCEQIIAKFMANESVNKSDQTLSGNISAPINLVSNKLAQGHYLNVDAFATDVRKIWANSWTNNKPGTPLYMSATAMSNEFEEFVRSITGQQAPRQNLKKPKVQNTKASTSKNDEVLPMTIQEKGLLRSNIMKLDPSKMQGLIDIIQTVVNTKKSQESLEFDLEKLPLEVCRKLETYVNACISTAQPTKNIKSHTQEPTVSFLLNT